MSRQRIEQEVVDYVSVNFDRASGRVPFFMERICRIVVCYIYGMVGCYN